MNITVYLGALEGNDPALGDAVRELGTWIGESRKFSGIWRFKVRSYGTDSRKCAECRGEK